MLLKKTLLAWLTQSFHFSVYNPKTSSQGVSHLVYFELKNKLPYDNDKKHRN